ncbi:MAG: hypothetical protein ACYDDF_04955 [Thermoplasmatota archaeon]
MEVKIPLAGTHLSPNVRTWSNSDRFAATVSLGGLAGFLIVLLYVIWLILPSWIPWFLPYELILILLVLAAAVWINFEGFDVARHEPAAIRASADVAPPALRPNLTLRCSECATIFELEDPGFRPLYHVCPGCGVTGVIEPERPSTPAPPPAAPRPAPAEVPGAESESMARPAAVARAGDYDAVPPPPPPHEPPPTPPPPEPIAAAQASPAAAETAFEPIRDEATLARYRRPPEAAPAPAPITPARAPVPAAPSSPAAPAGPKRRVKFTCKKCGNPQIVVDTGVRPLIHTCDACGTKAKLNLPG